ncbi:hypothetical protein [Thioclava sp. DLFJ4-1]|uniref:hypothetical protein n=1 Tax=Thioclava sp. DLFJ4-1 TaxID=1915313 RepID=UPI000997CC91|nr:hypothetical protein [Thioclava sp. DLFJ4-1]OOY14419.1 hypothetical protein BMI85_20115 [Thioclava sp. DLFJ4-1]
MIANLIVVTATLLIAGFLIARIFVPGAKAWFEAPKHRFMRDETAHADRHRRKAYGNERPMHETPPEDTDRSDKES